MTFVKANNYDQAVKELATQDEKLVSQIPDKIDSAEKEMFHVITVKVNDRPGQAKNEVVQNVQKYHQVGFDKLKKNFLILGFATLIVLHDPNAGTEEELDETTFDEEDFSKQTVANKVASEIAGKSNAEIEAEIEEKVERRLQMIFAANIIDEGKVVTQEALENHDASLATEDVKTESKKLSKEELDKVFEGTVKDFKAFAESNSIDVNGLTTRAQFLEAFTTWNDNQK